MAEDGKKELPPSVIIHKISSEQWRDYEFLRLEMLKNNPQNFNQKQLEDLHNSEDVWKKRIDEGIIIVAYDKINPIGFVRSKFFENKSKLYELFVKVEFNEYGLEEKLITEMVSMIEDSRRVRVIEVLINKDSLLLEFYQSLGFFEDLRPSLKNDKYLALKKPI